MTKRMYARNVSVVGERAADGPKPGWLWAYAAPGSQDRGRDTIALLALRDRRDASPGYKEVDAYLNRALVKELIETLQDILDSAGPEPFDPAKVSVGDDLTEEQARQLPIGSRVAYEASSLKYTVEHGGELRGSLTGGLMNRGGAGGYTLRVERIGPEPIVEPECDYVLSRSGMRWYRTANGKWDRSKDAPNACISFGRLLREAGPLTPVAIEHVQGEPITVPV